MSAVSVSKNSAVPSQSSRGRVALGMSGGVDSSVAAHLLVEQGYDVTSVFLECWRAPGCRSEEDRKDALTVALVLGIPFQVLDFKDTYKQKVVEYFFAEYAAGRTPNPDVMCNKEIKFGLFYDWAMDQGFDFVATGHYAQIGEYDHQPVLLSAVDEHKDQTYFLYLLQADQLAHILFPIGHLTKPQVRQEAVARQLHVATKKDSVGICFIGDINVHDFLFERLGENLGDVVDTSGHVIGKHKGLWFYTIGQRHGFTIEASTLIHQSDGSVINKHNIPPFYVIAKKPAENQLVVGFGVEALCQSFRLIEMNWLLKPETEWLTNHQLQLRIRHTGQLVPATLEKGPTGYQVRLQTAIPGIAEGQSGVCYYPHPNQSDRLICLGGGIISLS